MAKAQAAAARFATEVAPPPVVPVTRRGKKVSLDTIAEDDREQMAAYESDHQGFAAAWSRRPAPAKARERAGRFLIRSDLSRCFVSDAYGQQAAPAAGRVAITS